MSREWKPKPAKPVNETAKTVVQSAPAPTVPPPEPEPASPKVAGRGDQGKDSKKPTRAEKHLWDLDFTKAETANLQPSELTTLKKWLRPDRVSPTAVIFIVITYILVIAMVVIGPQDAESVPDGVRWVLVGGAVVSSLFAIGLVIGLMVRRFSRMDRTLGIAAYDLLRLVQNKKSSSLLNHRRNLATVFRRLRGTGTRAGIAISSTAMASILSSEHPYTAASEPVRTLMLSHLKGEGLDPDVLLQSTAEKLLALPVWKTIGTVIALLVPIAVLIVELFK